MDNGYVDVVGETEVNGVESPQLPTMNKKIIMDRIRDDRVNPDTGEREYLIKWKPIKESWERAVEVELFNEFVQSYKVTFLFNLFYNLYSYKFNIGGKLLRTHTHTSVRCMSIKNENSKHWWEISQYIDAYLK
jgi:hypothetical protein